MAGGSICADISPHVILRNEVTKDLLATKKKILRFAQNDRVLPNLVME